MRIIDPQLIDVEKKKLRLHIKEQKKLLSLEDRAIQSSNIVKQIENNSIFQAAKTVMAYWALKDEVDLSELVVKYSSSKQFILPSVKGDELEIRVFEEIDLLTTGSSFGILEPSGAVYIKFDKIDLILVPGLAFDLKKNRMGRGKAYYDKFLPKTTAKKIGVCFDIQLLETVPVTERDVKMDEVISFTNP